MVNHFHTDENVNAEKIVRAVSYVEINRLY